MTAFKYLQGYPPHLQQQVMQMVAEHRLGDYLARRYPNRHQVQSDKALYGYAQELRQQYLSSLKPLLFQVRGQQAQSSALELASAALRHGAAACRMQAHRCPVGGRGA